MEVYENGRKTFKNVITNKEGIRIDNILSQKMKDNWDKIENIPNVRYLNGYQGAAFNVLFMIGDAFEKSDDSCPATDLVAKANKVIDRYKNEHAFRFIELGEGAEDEFYGLISACDDIKNILVGIPSELKEAV